jgi:LysM repeat protein
MHHGPASRPKPAAVHKQKAVRKHVTRGVYVVRAGDTITAIAAKTGVPADRLLKLNPKISPTALFIGEKIRFR